MSSRDHPTGTDSLWRRAGVVGGLTLVSRFFGFLRDAAIAHVFGAGLVTDAFYMSFTIPNILRRFFAEGTMTIAFIPILSRERNRDGQGAVRSFVNAVFGLALLLLPLVVVAGILLAPFIVSAFAWGWRDDPERFELTIHLTRLMFPYLMLISLAALTMGVLNSYRYFAAPAAAPIMLNLAVISAALWLCPRLLVPATGLALGVLAGGLLQILIQTPHLRATGVFPRPAPNWRHPAVRSMLRMMAPALLGMGLYQLNLVLARLFASFLGGPVVSYLFWADRLSQIPLGVIAIAFATVTLPTLSDQAAEGEEEQVKETLIFSLRSVLFLVLPACAGLIVLARPIVSVVYLHGQFTLSDVGGTAGALVYFTLGLWAVACVRVTAPVFYAFKDTKRPVVAGAAALLAYVVTALALMSSMGHLGLALAVSISSMVNLAVLVLLLRRWLPGIDWHPLMGSILKTLAACLALALAAGVLASLGDWTRGPTATNIILLALAVAAGGAVFFLAARLLGCQELRELRRQLK